VLNVEKLIVLRSGLSHKVLIRYSNFWAYVIIIVNLF
jgi:hypothetical protein